jgi:hypothetical protein
MGSIGSPAKAVYSFLSLRPRDKGAIKKQWNILVKAHSEKGQKG